MMLTVLGSASGHAAADRSFSAYLVEASSASVLLDAGEGVSRQLVRYDADPEKIDAVFVSHTHPDHAAGIFGLLQWMFLCGRKQPFAVYLPAGIRQSFETVFPVFQIVREKWKFDFVCFPISPGKVFEKNGFVLQAVPNGHLAPNRSGAEQVRSAKDSYSFCLADAGRTLVFTSDVPDLNHLHACADRSDMLLVECTHIGIGDILAFSRTHGISKTILSHIPPSMDSLPPTSLAPDADPDLRQARDGDTFEV